MNILGILTNYNFSKSYSSLNLHFDNTVYVNVLACSIKVRDLWFLCSPHWTNDLAKTFISQKLWCIMFIFYPVWKSEMSAMVMTGRFLLCCLTSAECPSFSALSVTSCGSGTNVVFYFRYVSMSPRVSFVLGE